MPGRGFDDFLRRDPFGGLGRPSIDRLEPAAAAPGDSVRVRGRNLVAARIRFGKTAVKVHKRATGELRLTVPDGIGRVDVIAESPYGRSDPIPFDITPAASHGPFTFRGDARSFGGPGHSIVATGVNQPYLILTVLPDDLALPAGTTEARVIADVTQRCLDANEYWSEASYGKTSFAFDIHPAILRLPDPMEAYDRQSEPKTLTGSGVAFPVAMVGTETLVLTGDDGLEVTVPFVAGDRTLFEIITAINDEVDATYAGPGDRPIEASNSMGQLRITTGREAADSILEVAGAAVALLGLDEADVTVSDGVDRVDDDYKKIRDALVERVDGLTNAEADAFLSQFDGVGVCFAAGTVRASATIGGWNFDVRDEQYSLSNFNIDTTYPWQVWAHEIGHNLTFPDLYDEPGAPELVGVEPGNWDMMHNGWVDSHPSAWIKHEKTASADRWMTAVEILEAPPGDATGTAEALLVPTSTPVPGVNPFAASHPGIPLRHAIKIVLSPDRALFVENRQEAFASADLGDASFDNAIPDQGVIVTDAVNTMDGLPVFRSWIVMATGYWDPLDTDGEEDTVLDITPLNKIKVQIVERIGANPAVFHVKVTWGEGSYFDYRIRDWEPPPWESKDIWVDTRVDNDWDEYTHTDAGQNPDVVGNPVLNGDRSRVGWESRVYARVWNDGDIARPNVRVRFQVVVPAAIGPSPGVDIGDDVINLPAGGFGLASISWTPRDANEGHVCVRAMVDADPDELNANNNMAQENITDWYLEGASPYAPVMFPYQVTNPLPRRAIVRMAARGLRPGWYVRVDPVQFWLEPGETIMGHATVMADVGVPFEDLLLAEGIPLPLISVEAQTKYNDAWAPFGGVSGTAHPVRKADLDVNHDPGGDRVHITGVASTNDGPISDANVSIRLLAADCQLMLAIDRTRTDGNGQFAHAVVVPDPSEHYFVEVLLSPTVGTGPAEHGPISIGPLDGSAIAPGPPRLDFPGVIRPPLDAIRRWRFRRIG